MSISTIIITILGLGLFETVTSVDNAVINAEILSTMSPRGRRWFLVYGMVLAVVVVRGIVPLLIVWAANPSLGLFGSFNITFSNSAAIQSSINHSAPVLLISGGTFMLFLFLHWLFVEPKNYGLAVEKFFHEQAAWFYALASILLALIVWLSLETNALMAFGAVLGSSAFFLVHGFRRHAEEQESKLLHGTLSEISKITYLEILDASFSIDGVIGAFAFTFSVPLILIGNGLGAIVLRQLTVSNIDRIKKYVFLKNGAMYSILFLGVVMLLDAFGFNIPAWASPVITFLIVAYFFLKSRKLLKLKA